MSSHRGKRPSEAQHGNANRRRWADACGDWAERAALDESIREGIEDMEAGGTVDAKAIAQLRYCP